MPRPVARRLTAALLVAGLALAGCSSDDEPAADRSTTTTTAPAADAERGLTAAQVAGSTDDDTMLQGLAIYQPYVEQQAGTVARDVARFTDAVRAGDVELAKELYPASRQAYLRIEPLVPLIAPGVARVVEAQPPAGLDEAEDPQITGWHQLEWDLWVSEDLSGAKATADQLDEELAKLADAAADFTVTPKAMVLGTAMLMDWAADDAASDAVEPYAVTHLWDLAARVDAANAARQMFRDAVGNEDPEAAAAIDDRSQDAIDAIAPHRTAEGWTSYDDVTDAQRTDLATAFRAFADALAAGSDALGFT